MKIYLSEYIHPEADAKLRANATVVNNFENIEELDAIILRNVTVTREMMEKAKNLKLIAKHGVGTNTIDLEAAKELGIPVIFTPTTNVSSVAELIVGLILNSYRGIYQANKNCRIGIYDRIAPAELTGLEIKGKTVGLIGMGNIAITLAEILHNGFGAEIICYDPYLSDERADSMGIKKFDKLKEMIKQSDIINISVPLTPSTHNLISGDVFDCFKPDSILINAARGGVINEDDLYNALVSKKLRAAACDAFIIEPPSPTNSKLLSLDNFSATPHIGGSTEESLYRTGMEVITEPLNFLRGGKAKNLAYK